jgi:two-component system, NarL family, sensor histidine kinase UhpB
MTNDSNVPLRIVLLEDDLADAELIQNALQSSGLRVQWQHALGERDFRETLQAEVPDLVLADYTLPGFDGMTALRLVREHWPDVPFIFVSGSLGEERAIDALKSGATDYVLKDRMQRLPNVAQRALHEAHERQELRHAQSAFEEQRVLLSTLIDNLPDVIYAVGRDERLKVVNRALLDRVKQPRHMVLGRKSGDFPELCETGEDSESVDSHIMRSGRAQNERERAAMARDGTVHWHIDSKIPLRDAATGTVAGLVCTSRDITTRKELEQEILEISNREQRRLGSDLHDGLGQELTGLSLLLKSLEVQVARESPHYLPQLSKITALVAHTIQSTRSLACGLAPVNLERGGLPEALRLLAQRCTDMYGLSCRFDDHSLRLPELDEGSATHLYRIAQEATTNAARYARAKSIQIELRNTPRKLQLSIADDGIGLTRGLAQGKPGLGLKIMEYRAHMMGGAVSFDEPDVGTRVLLSCPLHLLRRGRTHQRRTA